MSECTRSSSSSSAPSWSRTITSELDFALEAEHTQRFTHNFEGNPNSPERIGNEVWRGEVWRGIERLSSAVYDLSQQRREIFDDLWLGWITVRTTDTVMPPALDRLGRRLFAGLVVAVFVAAGTWLLASRTSDGLGVVLLAFGVLATELHVARDVIRHWR